MVSDTMRGVCPRETLWVQNANMFLKEISATCRCACLQAHGQAGGIKCSGFVRNVICNLGVSDLEQARSRGCLVLNKFGTRSDSAVAAVFCHFLHFVNLLANQVDFEVEKCL